MNNQIDFNNLHTYDAFILSPGPGLPAQAGQMMEFIDLYWSRKPILGICLGMQALAIHQGYSLYNLPEILHGREDQLTAIHPESVLLKDIQNFTVGRYHSWAVTPLKNGVYTPTSYSTDQVMMTFESTEHQAFGIQFHPESIMTPEGKKMLYNFIALVQKNLI